MIIDEMMLEEMNEMLDVLDGEATYDYIWNSQLRPVVCLSFDLSIWVFWSIIIDWKTDIWE